MTKNAIFFSSDETGGGDTHELRGTLQRNLAKAIRPALAATMDTTTLLVSIFFCYAFRIALGEPAFTISTMSDGRISSPRAAPYSITRIFYTIYPANCRIAWCTKTATSHLAKSQARQMRGSALVRRTAVQRSETLTTTAESTSSLTV